MSLQSTKWFRIAAIVVAVVAFLLLGIRAALHVANGEAADTYINVKGVHFTWGGALVGLILFVFALGAAFVVRWWHKRGGWMRSARFSRPRTTGRGTPADMPPNKSLERSREP
jgi:hypothetical protein